MGAVAAVDQRDGSSDRGSKGDAVKVATSDRILQAALATFAQQGVAGTSLDALARQLGIRKQTILYWFGSKEQLLLGVIDHAVAELGERLRAAVSEARPERRARLVAVVDATFRLGTTDPELLALLREVLRQGPPASSHLAAALEPLVAGAVAGLAAADPSLDVQAARRILLDTGSRVVGLATEAEIRTELGLPPDLAWLRARRTALLADLSAALT